MNIVNNKVISKAIFLSGDIFITFCHCGLSAILLVLSERFLTSRNDILCDLTYELHFGTDCVFGLKTVLKKA